MRCGWIVLIMRTVSCQFRLLLFYSTVSLVFTQRHRDAAVVCAVVQNEFTGKKNNNNFHLPREIATRIVKQKAISSHQRNVRCRWFFCWRNKREKNPMPDYGMQCVCVRTCIRGALKIITKTHAHKRSFVRQDSVCGVEAQWFFHWQDHLEAFGTHGTHRQRTGQKSHTIYRKINLLFSSCSWSSERFVVGIHFGKRTDAYDTNGKEREKQMWIQVTVMRIKSISFSASFHFHSVQFRHSVEHKRLQHTAHSTQLPIPVCEMR